MPSHLLPMPNCSKADGKQRPSAAAKVRFQEPNNSENPPKRARFNNAETSQDRQMGHRPSSGLSKTVQDLIKSYVPASLEKKAFYCRCCKFEGSSEEDLFSHRQSEAHIAAVELERKASYCRLCRKQFTSPEQIKEHLKGKAHKAALETAMSKNGRSKTTAAGVKLDRI